MNLMFRPYNIQSNSCKELATKLTEKLGYKVWRIRDHSNKPQPDSLVVNWGSARPFGRLMLNAPQSIAKAISKLRTFHALRDRRVNAPQFTDSREHAAHFGTTFARKDGLRGGDGIVICKPGQDLPEADFYVQYIPPICEMRVHVFNSTVIDYVQKGRKNGDKPEGDAAMIRNRANGWIFMREDVQLSGNVAETAKAAVMALGLNFGAVDILLSKLDGHPYVLEVNTAPGLEGTTLDKYVEAFASLGSENEQAQPGAQEG